MPKGHHSHTSRSPITQWELHGCAQGRCAKAVVVRGICKEIVRQNYNLISKFHVRLKSLLQQGLSELEFNSDLIIYK